MPSPETPFFPFPLFFPLLPHSVPASALSLSLSLSHRNLSRALPSRRTSHATTERSVAPELPSPVLYLPPCPSPFPSLSRSDPSSSQRLPLGFGTPIAISNTHCNGCEADEEDGIVCAICQSTNGDPSDPIVFCDGCDLMVHASYYGNPLIQAILEGDWYCSRYELAKAKPEGEDFSCCLCPIKGGAVKPTVDGRWAHVMCVLLVPEVFFRRAVRELIALGLLPGDGCE